MKLFELLEGVDYKLLQGNNPEINRIEIDSRKVEAGDVFICIEGFEADGHNFALSAVKAGAASIIVSKDVEPMNDVTIIKVSDTRAAMSLMASNLYGRPAKNYPLLGVTGTNGKTSSTYFLESILSYCGIRAGLIGTVATKVGDEPVKTKFATSTTPDPVELQQIFKEMFNMGAEAVVMEVSSHALELKKMEGLKFSVSVFTNLTRDHLDLHGTMENYARAKAKLFEISDTSVINMDDDYGGFMKSYACSKVLTYSINKPSDLQAFNVVCESGGVSFDLKIDNETINFEIPIPGRFTVYNALGVIGAALAYGISPEVIRGALKSLKGVPGRIQSIANDRGIGVFVDYSHTPDSLENILTSVREFAEGKVIVVFGCGGDRDKEKRPMMGEIAARLSDYAVITSDNPRREDPDTIIDEVEAGVRRHDTAYIKLADRREAIKHAISIANKGDCVVIAGKGHENYQVFADKTIHFDDAEEAAEVLKGR